MMKFMMVALMSSMRVEKFREREAIRAALSKAELI
jgi:hypothetical protein